MAFYPEFLVNGSLSLVAPGYWPSPMSSHLQVLPTSFTSSVHVVGSYRRIPIISKSSLVAISLPRQVVDGGSMLLAPRPRRVFASSSSLIVSSLQRVLVYGISPPTPHQLRIGGSLSEVTACPRRVFTICGSFSPIDPHRREVLAGDDPSASGSRLMVAHRQNLPANCGVAQSESSLACATDRSLPLDFYRQFVYVRVFEQLLCTIKVAFQHYQRCQSS